MEFKLNYSPKFLDDLLAIGDYIELQLFNPSGAVRITNGIMDATDILAKYPETGARIFLPGGLDLSTYRIGFDSESLLLNGETVQSGQTPASALRTDEANELIFANGEARRKTALILMTGDELPSLYITTESAHDSATWHISRRRNVNNHFVICVDSKLS